jgi:hypothetical protein
VSKKTILVGEDWLYLPLNAKVGDAHKLLMEQLETLEANEELIHLETEPIRHV